MSKEEAIVKQWGFAHVYTWTDEPNAHYPPHSHPGLTTHLITKGEMTLWFPDDSPPQKVTYGVGARVDVDAGRLHQVEIASSGCTYVVGE